MKFELFKFVHKGAFYSFENIEVLVRLVLEARTEIEEEESNINYNEIS